MNNFLIGKKKIPFLVIHGTDDHSLNIADTDRFIEKLNSSGYNIDYRRIDGGGHGNFDSINIIFDWLSKTNY